MHKRFEADTFFATLVLLSLLDKLDEQEDTLDRYEGIILAQDASISDARDLLEAQADTLALDLEVIFGQSDTIARQRDRIAELEAALADKQDVIDLHASLVEEDALDLDESEALIDFQKSVLDLQGETLREVGDLALAQKDTIEQITRAIDDLGLGPVIAKRLITNLGLDLMGIGEGFTGATTMRSADLDAYPLFDEGEPLSNGRSGCYTG